MSRGRFVQWGAFVLVAYTKFMLPKCQHFMCTVPVHALQDRTNILENIANNFTFSMTWRCHGDAHGVPLRSHGVLIGDSLRGHGACSWRAKGGRVGIFPSKTCFSHPKWDKLGLTCFPSFIRPKLKKTVQNWEKL